MLGLEFIRDTRASRISRSRSVCVIFNVSIWPRHLTAHGDILKEF